MLIPPAPATCPASKWEVQLTHPAIHHDIKADPVGFHQGAELHPSCVSVIFGKPGETWPRGDLSLAGPSLFGGRLGCSEIYKHPQHPAQSGPRRGCNPLRTVQQRFVQIFEVPARHSPGDKAFPLPMGPAWGHQSTDRADPTQKSSLGFMASPGQRQTLSPLPEALTSAQLSLLALPTLTPALSKGAIMLTPRKGHKTRTVIRQQAQSPLPEVVPGRDRVSRKCAVQTAKMIARVAFRRRFIKITVPFNLNSYHTTLDEAETRISAQNALEMDRSHLFTESLHVRTCSGQGPTRLQYRSRRKVEGPGV